MATALASARESVRVQSAQIDAIFAGMADGIMVVDADFRLVRWNDRFPVIAGVPTSILKVGLDVREILRAQAAAGEFGAVDVEAEVARRTALFQSSNGFSNIERVRPTGDILELQRGPMEGGGFVTLYTDITEKRRAEEQLRQSLKMEAVGQLTSGIAHDFNNFLAIILGNLELAISSLHRADSMRAEHHINSSVSGAQRAVTLTQRLLAFARQQRLDSSPIDVNKIVAGLSELIRHSIGTDNHLETVLAGELWEAVVDGNQLENALLNLAVNARDAVGSGGKITIETANTHLDAAYAAEHSEVTAGQFVMVAVSDNGQGMTPDQVRRAFEPFFTTKEVGKGSGLGLSQVFGFIKQSHGHVKIYSEPGAGTTVKLYLPRVHSSLDELVVPAVDLCEPDASRPLRATHNEIVLLVEDEPEMLAYGVEALKELGYRVVAAKNASLALLALESDPAISLLFTDIELPDMNGPALADQAMRLRPDLPVLFATGYTANDVAHKDLLAPGMALLCKPFTLRQLAASIHEVLDPKRSGVDA